MARQYNSQHRYLQSGLHPVERRQLEELGGLEAAEEVASLLRLGRLVLERVEDVVFEKLLVADAHLHRLAGGTVLPVPGVAGIVSG